MSTKLLHIQPKELHFIFEVRKQSSCTVELANNTHHYVAYKVKTTSPKKYCVRPNVGIILPKSTCDFSVIMQAQRAAPPDMLCRDKFLIQSTIVPSGTTEEDITASMFSKDGGKYIEEDKLRVTLISPPSSPILSPINGALEGIMDEAEKVKEQSGPLRDRLATSESPKLKDQNGASNEVLPTEVSTLRDQNGPSNEGMPHEASRFKDENSALKGGRPIEVLKPRDQNGALREEVLLHETSRLKNQNRTSKEEVLLHETTKLKDQNRTSKEEVLLHETTRLKDQNRTSKEDVLLHETTRQKDQNRTSKEEVLLHETTRLKDQNRTSKEEVLLHETTRPKDQNRTSKEELPREALKPRDQNGALKEEPTVEVPKIRVQNRAQEGLAYETPHLDDQLSSGVHPPQYIIPKGVDESQELNNIISRLAKTAEIKQAAELELMTLKQVDRLKLVKDIDEMKSKLNEIELKLGEAQGTIAMLSEERRSSAREVKFLKHKLMELSRRDRPGDQVGFPPLFICMVALICIVLGYILRL